MCGIFGFWLNRQLNSNDIFKGKLALEKLIHRGPDNLNYWYDEKKGIFLGHTRLSIIGLESKNNQPLINNKSVLTYNGEIYNYMDIKKLLIKKNYQFNTDTDTEVVQHAWDYFGDKCFDHFDGMYAFSLYDYDKLYLVTDNFGEKPIYYIKNNLGFYFSSEPKNIIEFLNLKFEPTNNNIIDFLSLGFVPAPETGYQDLKYLNPASILTINKNLDVNKKKYWQLENIDNKNKKKIFEKNDLKNIKNLIIGSIENRLNADVNLGIFLSSGIDSSLIASIISKELNYSLDSFTLSFPDGVDESQLAKKIANHLNIKNYTINYLDDNFSNDITKSTYSIYCQLNDNLTALSIRQLSKFAKQYVKVVLGGVGGDELFYGYNKYRLANSLQKYDFFFLPKILNFIKMFSKHKKIENAIDYLDSNEYLRFIAIKNLSIKRILRKFNLNPENKFINCDKDDFVNKIRNFDLNYTLQNSYLTSVDRGSMFESLEIRSPYLHRELFDYMNQFCSSVFFKNESKFIQKNILKSYLPLEYFENKKMGFISPLKIKKNQLSTSNFPPQFKELVEYTNDLSKNSISNKLYQRMSLVDYIYERK
jgi:asparagine synthase (glutamine-hydrolysing)